MLCSKYTKREDIAEDIVQDVFASLWEENRIFPSQANFRSFLYISIRNAAFDYLRHQNVESRYIEEALTANRFLSDDSFQMMPVLENQLAGKNKQPLAFVATEMTETMVEQLRQFSGVRGSRTVVEPASRIECDAGLGRIGNDKRISGCSASFIYSSKWL